MLLELYFLYTMFSYIIQKHCLILNLIEINLLKINATSAVIPYRAIIKFQFFRICSTCPLCSTNHIVRHVLAFSITKFNSNRNIKIIQNLKCLHHSILTRLYFTCIINIVCRTYKTRWRCNISWKTKTC